MTTTPSVDPAPAATDALTVAVTTDDGVMFTSATTRATDDLVVIVTPDVVPDEHVPVGETHAPRLVTALVGLGLIAVAGGMLASAATDDSGGRTLPAESVAENTPAEMPTTVRVLGGQRTGDVVMIRVDPVGDGGKQTLVVAPDASVSTSAPVGALAAGTAQPIQNFLDAMAAGSVRQAQFSLRYDADGAIVAITLAN